LSRGDGKAGARQKFYGIACFQNRIVLASAPGGAWEFSGGKVAPLRSTCSALGIYETQKVLFFIEEEQDPRPSIIEF